VPKPPPRKFHFDRRIRQILAANIGAPDDLLCTKQTAELFGISVEWFEVARCGEYGPQPTVLSPRRIRYSRQSIDKFLRERLRTLSQKRF